MKELSRKYGWAAAGVYAVLSVLDFMSCFIVIRAFGAETVGKYEHAALHWVKETFGWSPQSRQDIEAAKHLEEEESSVHVGDDGRVSLWTEVAVAYGLHKLLIFLRVPITVSITPPLVKRLRKMGWNIGRASAK
jgi:hypothetical protein